jgi:transcriptional regulator with XRE-family HTH domain
MSKEWRRLETAVFGSVVSLLRRLRGLTQSELAGLCGTTRAQVVRWEGGREAPSTSSLGDLAAALEVPEARLLGLQKRVVEFTREDPHLGLLDIEPS